MIELCSYLCVPSEISRSLWRIFVGKIVFHAESGHYHCVHQLIRCKLKQAYVTGCTCVFQGHRSWYLHRSCQRAYSCASAPDGNRSLHCMYPLSTSGSGHLSTGLYDFPLRYLVQNLLDKSLKARFRPCQRKTCQCSQLFQTWISRSAAFDLLVYALMLQALALRLCGIVMMIYRSLGKCLSLLDSLFSSSAESPLKTSWAESQRSQVLMQ